jgi:phosphate transport system substrate-binding protein
MAVKWAEEFRKIHPAVRIDISAGGAGKGMTDVLSGVADIALVSREVNETEYKKGAFPIAVTKDAVIPTISAKNPLIHQIMKSGVKRSAFNSLWVTGRSKTWGHVLGTKSTIPVHVYTRSDAAGAAETWAAYFNIKQEDLLGVGVFGDPGLAQAVQKDAIAIGFNNIVYVYDLKTKKPTNGVLPCPIDLNENGFLDADENFYGNVDSFVKAVAGGKYPEPPARDLYFVTKGKPNGILLKEFIKYVLSTGQQYVHLAGYIELPDERVKKEIERIK